MNFYESFATRNKYTLNKLIKDTKRMNNKELYELFIYLLQHIQICKERYEIIYYKVSENERGMIIFEKEEIKKLYTLIKKADISVIANISYEWCAIEYHKDYYNGNEYMKILSARRNKIHYIDKKFQIGNGSKSKITFYEPRKIYCNAGDKFFPANLKSLSYINQDILGILFKYYMNDSIIFKDILKEYSYCKANLAIPIRLELLWNGYSKQEILQKQCNLSLPKSINKYTLKTGYLVVKSFKYVKENEWQKLLHIPGEEYGPCDNINGIFYVYYHKIFNFNSDSDELENILNDYITMTIKMKKTFNMKMTSVARLIDEHNKLAIAYRCKYTKNITIPKNSIFNKLKLPKEWQRIKTKQALVEESILNNNCVASYDDKINRDKCAIFTRMYEGKRYTIEIIYKKYKGKYKFAVRQIYGKSNSIAPEQLEKELNKLIYDENLRLS